MTRDTAPSPWVVRPLPAGMFDYGFRNYRPTIHVERAAFAMARHVAGP